MDKKDLIYYLTDLSRVQNLKPEELEAWLAKYPYSQNLHLLHAKKQFQQDGAFSEGDVIYSTQRSHFFRQVEEQTWDTFDVEQEMPIQAQRYATKIPLMTGAEDHALPEEPSVVTSEIGSAATPYAEGPALESVQEIPIAETEPESLPPAQNAYPTLIPDIIKTMMASGELPPAPQPPVHATSAPPATPAAPATPSMDKPVPAQKAPSNSRTIPTIPNGNGVSAFSKWLHDLRRPFEEQPIQLDDDKIDNDIPLTAQARDLIEFQDLVSETEIRETENPENRESSITKPETQAPATEQTVKESVETECRNPYVELAKSSNEVKDHIGSETLAKLLYNQGFRDLAIQMYERLALKNPEKSSYFADQIRIIRENL